jgi:hypothetical protein
VKARGARYWLRQYARAYGDCNRWLASWCTPWAWLYHLHQDLAALRRETLAESRLP